MTSRIDLWDAVAGLLDYPADPSYVDRLTRSIEQLEAASCDAAVPLVRMRDEVKQCSLGSLQEQFIAAFDFDPQCTLEIGWHLFSDTPDRGPWLAEIREDLARVEVEESGELPDHLRHLLMLVPREAPPRRATLAALMMPVVQDINTRVAAKGNAFAGVLDAAQRLLETQLEHQEVGHD